MPFLSEHLWQALRCTPGVTVPDFGTALLARAAFPTATALAPYRCPNDAAIEPVIARAQTILHAIRSLRQNVGALPSSPDALVVGVADASVEGELAPLLPVLARMARVAGLRFDRRDQADRLDRSRASVVVVDAVTDVALDLAALPDLARHEALLGTRLGNVRRELEALVARMATATVQPDRVPDAVRARWAEQRTTLTAAATQLTADIAAVRNAMHRSA